MERWLYYRGDHKARFHTTSASSVQLAWAVQEQSQKEENVKLRVSVQELQRQNQILHEQMEQVGVRKNVFFFLVSLFVRPAFLI